MKIVSNGGIPYLPPAGVDLQSMLVPQILFSPEFCKSLCIYLNKVISNNSCTKFNYFINFLSMLLQITV